MAWTNVVLYKYVLEVVNQTQTKYRRLKIWCKEKQAVVLWIIIVAIYIIIKNICKKCKCMATTWTKNICSKITKLNIKFFGKRAWLYMFRVFDVIIFLFFVTVFRLNNSSLKVNSCINKSHSWPTLILCMTTKTQNKVKPCLTLPGKITHIQVYTNVSSV